MINKTVAILGGSGMLGSAVYDVLKDKYRLILVVRNRKKIDLLEKKFGGTDRYKVLEFDAAKVYDDYVKKQTNPSPYLANFLQDLGDIGYVINCIGVTIPFSLENPNLTFFINSALPHILSQYLGEKLIHITTDCVYNGTEGFPYDENAVKTPVDLYGLSKSLGEPVNCLTFRTSIIGRELEGFTGLLDWFLQQEGKELKGFGQHFWNGITTKQFGKICDQIIQNPEKFPKAGLFHIFSTTVSKYDMLVAFQNKFHSNNEIKRDDTQKLNRCLSTVYEFNSSLKIPSFLEMINEL